MRELEAFGAVNGHELDGVAGGFIVEAYLAQAGLFEVVEIFEKFGERARFAFGLPGFEKFDELRDVAARAWGDEMWDFEPVDERAENVDGRAALEIFALARDEFEKFSEGFGRWIKWQVGLRRLERVVDRGAFFARALGEAHEIDGLEMPRGRGEDASGGDVVERLVDEAEVCEDVADERMLEDGEARDDERNFALGEFFDETVAVIVLAIEDGEVAPGSAGAVEALEFAGDPGGFFVFVGELGDADALALGVRGGEDFVGEVGADFVLRDDLGGDAEDVGRGAVIFGERDAIGG